jgi:hypothetical protein
MWDKTARIGERGRELDVGTEAGYRFAQARSG